MLPLVDHASELKAPWLGLFGELWCRPILFRFDLIVSPVLGVGVLLLLWLEHHHPLRACE
jgi:hypothetical protein